MLRKQLEVRFGPLSPSAQQRFDSLSAAQIADRVKKSFPAARIDYEPDPVRTAIVASWPEDVDDTRARTDWGWQPRYPWDRAFDEYLVPNITARYAK